MTTVELASPKGPRPIHPTRFRQAEGAFNIWSVVPDEGTSLDDVMTPDYWAHNAHLMRPNDRILVDAEDGSWTATLFVRSVTRLSALVALISKTEFAAVDASSVEDDFIAKWKGPINKWSVVKASDHAAILQNGFEAKDDALKYIADNAKSLAA
tara:strand:- start:17676 stop:18137 length:462 start_codon:yes stop_codon:yes gene_type:complete